MKLTEREIKILDSLIQFHSSDMFDDEERSNLLKKIKEDYELENRYRFCKCGDYIATFEGNCKTCGSDLKLNVKYM